MTTQPWFITPIARREEDAAKQQRTQCPRKDAGDWEDAG